MIRTTPLRRTTLQLSQILVTEAFTFIAVPFLFVAVDDAPASEIVGRQLHRDLVPGQNLDEVHPHLARDVGEHLVSVLQLDAEHRVGKGLDDRPLDLDTLFFRHSLLNPP